MKKISKILIVLILLLAVVLFVGTLLKPESKQINLNIQDTKYIEIRYHNKTYKITNDDIVDEFVKKFSNLTFRKHSITSKIKDFAASPSKDSYKISYYDSDNRNNKLCEVEVFSDSEVKINDDKYEVVSNDDIYAQIKEITAYCIVPLPELTVNSIYQYSTSENIEMSKDEIYELYCKVLDCTPITQEEFKRSEEAVNFNTYDDEKVDIYIIENELYIQYTKGKTICYFKFNGNET